MTILRWTQEYQCIDPLSEWSPALYWKPPKTKNYHFTPSLGQTSAVGTSRAITLNGSEREVIRKLWTQPGQCEPLGHALRTEAQTLARESPRSALLICASALEVGVKTFISKAVNDSEWLMFNLPSPPIHTILKRYIPNIHKFDEFQIEWNLLNPAFRDCQKLFEDRNKLAHSGYAPEPSAITSYILLVRNFLYFMDFLNGQQWAEELLEEPFRAALHLKNPQQSRMQMHFRVGPDV